MRSLAIAVALLPFVLIEVGLRVFTAPSSSLPGSAVDLDPLVDLQHLRPLFVLNSQTDRWEIPPARHNFFQPDSFAAEKTLNTKRVFVLGGSTVQGRPYSIETAFSTWLRFRLQSMCPGLNIEVVNCGGVSYASYRVAKILDEVLAHQPDAIVVYTGHNEFLEDREYAEIREMSTARRWVSRLADKLRTVTWIRSQLRGQSLPSSRMPVEVDARLDHIGGLERYQRDPSWRVGVEQHFANSLQRMLLATEKANVPLFLCVPASELVDTPPFKTTPIAMPEGESAEFEQQWALAQARGARETRMSAGQRCLAADPEHAGAHYIVGRLHHQNGEIDQARRHLTAARDFDVCPLRATTAIIQSTFLHAQRHGIPLIDTTELLDQRDAKERRIPDGIVDPEFFVDHVHPTIAGHQLIATAIAKEFGQLGWSVSPDALVKGEATYQELAGKHLAELGEEYYARGRQRLEGLRRWASGRARELGGE